MKAAKKTASPGVAATRTIRPDSTGKLAQYAGQALKVVHSRVWHGEIWHRLVASPLTGEEISVSDMDTAEGMLF